MLKILVTGVGGGGHGEQIVKALKMSNKKYEIFGADCNPDVLDSAKFSKTLLLPRANELNYIEVLQQTISLEKIDVLFHGSEPELVNISKNINDIRSMGVYVPVNNYEAIKLCMDKNSLMGELSKLGYAPPKTILCTIDNIKDVDFFPIILKPSNDSGGSNDVFIAQNPKQLRNLIDYLNLDDDPRSFIIQEYVGTSDQEFTVGILCDSKGEYINSIAIKRNLSSQLSVKTRVRNSINNRFDLGRELIISSGISQGRIEEFAQIRDIAKKVVLDLGLKFSINVQCRWVQNELKIFEINPRFSGTTSIRALMGYNEPDVLIRKEVLSETIQTNFEYKFGNVTRSLTENLIER